MLDRKYPAGDPKIVLVLPGTPFVSSPNSEGAACLSEILIWVSTYCPLLQPFEG